MAGKRTNGRTNKVELTQQFIDQLPMRFGKREMAVLTGCCERYCVNHFKELGGMLLGGRVTWFRPTTLERLGLQRTQDVAGA